MTTLLGALRVGRRKKERIVSDRRWTLKSTEKDFNFSRHTRRRTFIVVKRPFDKSYRLERARISSVRDPIDCKTKYFRTKKNAIAAGIKYLRRK